MNIRLKLLIGRWAIRLCIAVVLFFVTVLIAKWMIATTKQGVSNTIRSSENQVAIEENKDSLEELKEIPTPAETATPAPRKQPQHRHRLRHSTPKSWWYRLWHP